MGMPRLESHVYGGAPFRVMQWMFLIEKAAAKDLALAFRRTPFGFTS